MKYALSLSLFALFSMSPMIAMEKGKEKEKSSQEPQKVTQQKKKLTPEEKKQKAMEAVKLTQLALNLAKAHMQLDLLRFEALISAKINANNSNNNNNTQPAAAPAIPVATSSSSSSSNSEAPLRNSTTQDLLNNRKTMTDLVQRTLALTTQTINELADTDND